MKVRYTAVFKLYGLSKVPDGADGAEFLRLGNLDITTTLTTDPEADAGKAMSPFPRKSEPATVMFALIFPNFFSRVEIG